MSEDAAAAARRIVAQVLQEHAHGPERQAPVPPEVAEDEVANDEVDGEPAPQGDATSERPTPAEPLTDAARIARRIVDEVLAAAPPAGAEAPPPEPGPAVEVRVEDVPAEGLPASGDAAAEVEVVADVPDGEGLSAAAIVRRIVAEVTDASDEEEDGPPPPPPRREPTRELEMTGGAGVESEPARHGPAEPSALETEPTREVPEHRQPPREHGEPPSIDAPESRLGPESVPVFEPEPEPEPEPGPEPEVAADLEPETGEAEPSLWPGAARAQEAAGSRVSVLEPEPAGFEATVPTGDMPRIAPPPAPEPQDEPGDGDREAKPHTLRWLLTSILGAVALAVLLPLAVGALRSLVSLG